MPVGFIAITIALLYLFFYKKDKSLYNGKIFIVTILLLNMAGYFIPAINIIENFELNVIFGFCILVLFFEFLLKSTNKFKLLIISFAIIVSVLYYVLTLINNDYLTFFNYLPIFLVITIVSLIFIKNYNAAVSFILLSYFVVELLNYFIFGSAIGYLSLYSYVVINYIVYSIAIYFIVKLLLNFLIKEKIKKPKEVNYEKK